MSRQLVRRALAASFIGLTVAGLAACGGDSVPTKDEIKAKMLEVNPLPPGTQGEMVDDVMDCIATGLVDKMSDDGLIALMDSDGTTPVIDIVSEADRQVLTEVTQKCGQDAAASASMTPQPSSYDATERRVQSTWA